MVRNRRGEYDVSGDEGEKEVCQDWVSLKDIAGLLVEVGEPLDDGGDEDGRGEADEDHQEHGHRQEEGVVGGSHPTLQVLVHQ